jgi:uncharacterized protein (DUF1778 family)
MRAKQSAFEAVQFCRDIVRRSEYPAFQRYYMAQRANRTEKLDLRLTRAAKETLQAAAVAAHKSVSEFVLESALNEASERLADRSVFTLDAEKWDAFIAALDAPPRRHARLERLFREPSVFDKAEK